MGQLAFHSLVFISEALDQARIVVLDVANTRAHRPGGHVIGRIGRAGPSGAEDRPSPRRAKWARRQVSAPRACVVKLGAEFVRRRGHDRKAADPFAGGRTPGLPQSGHGHQAAAFEPDHIRLLAGRGLLVKTVERHEAAPLPEGFAEGGLGLDLLGSRIDGREADLDVRRFCRRPERSSSGGTHRRARRSSSNHR
jgi:hypothetical protein